MRWVGAPVRRPGCPAGPPLCWEASGGEIPRCALAADSLPPGRFEPSPSRWRAATPPPPPVVWPWPHVAAPRLCPSPSVRPPQSAPRLLLPWAAPWCVSLPGLAAAAIRCRFRRRLSTDVVACLTRGSARDPRRPTRPPPRPRSGALALARVGSPVCRPRAGRRVLTTLHPPPLWGGWTDGQRGRGSAMHGVAWAGWRRGRRGGGVEEGGPPPSSPTLVDLDCVRDWASSLRAGGGGRVSRPSERLPEAPLPAASPWGSSCSPPRTQCIQGLSPCSQHNRLLVLAPLSGLPWWLRW